MGAPPFDVRTPIPAYAQAIPIPCPRSRSLHPCFVTSLLPYLVRRGLPRACYTVPPMARQRLGQHFLADLHWREEIARAIRVSPHSTVPLPKDDAHCWIEIGSGHGEMTQHLLATGTPVHAVELDPAFLPGLGHLAKQFPNLTIVPGDILEADVAAIAAGRRLRIYGNLPYYITSPILHHLFTFADFIDEIHIVIRLHRRNTHRHPERSRASPRGPTGHARLRLSFRRLPVLHASRTRLRDPSRRLRAAAGSRLHPGHAPPARRTRNALPQRRISFPGFCEIMFLAEA